MFKHGRSGESSFFYQQSDRREAAFPAVVHMTGDRK
jgi:hypothetical protein